MSIQSEINRINNNVQTTLNTIADTGVEVGTNSDALPAAAAALANEKANVSHTHATSDITSGTLGVARGGTGKASWTANRLVYPSASTTMNQLAFPSTAGSFLRQGTSGAPYWTPPADVLTAIGGAAKPKNVSITFTASKWTQGTDAFEQTVTVTGGTSNSLIALQPTAAQIVALQGDGVAALMVDNDNGTFIARAVAAAPSSNMTIQATVTEVTT